MSHTWILPLTVATAILAIACGSERAADDDQDYDVVVRDGSTDVADADADKALDEGLKGAQPNQETPPNLGSPPLDAAPPTVGSTPPGMELPQEEAVGWVSVSATDGVPYEVWQDGRMRGRSAVRLTQRPGDGEYVLRDGEGRMLCRGMVDVRQYESVCIECDVRTGKFRRAPC